MQTYKRELTLPYSAEDVFDMVLDIEAYPGFVPGWRSVRLIERGDNHLLVQQNLGVGPLSWRFVSRAEHARPNRITICSREAPFRSFRIDWHFMPMVRGCEVSLEMEIEFRSAVVDRSTRSLTPMLGGQTIAAFEEFARRHLDRIDSPVYHDVH